MDQSQIPTGYQNDLPAPNQVPVAGVPVEPMAPVLPQPPIAGQPLSQIPSMPQGVAPQAQGYSADSPMVADDVDLIEKEWVDKAKAIVARTRDDPSKQNQDINRFKADYLKTRYSKDIKISES